MASIALGAIGSAVAGPIGGMIGGQAGSLLDNLLLNHKSVRKPSMLDTLVEASTMGLPIPQVYGRMKLAGNLIQSSLLNTEKHSGKGGAMGGKGTPFYTYNVNCAVAICKGPIKNIWRIFADSKLIWDMDPGHTGPNTTHPGAVLVQSGFTPNANGTGGIATLYHYGTGKNSNTQQPGATVQFYFGTEDQGPDPTMSQYATFATGVPGSQPGYCGIAYVVFNGLPLADFGNRIPNFSFEVNGFYNGPTNIVTEPPAAANMSPITRLCFNVAGNTINTVVAGTYQSWNAQTAQLLETVDLTTDPIIAKASGPLGNVVSDGTLTFNAAQIGPDGSFWTVFEGQAAGGVGGIIVNISPFTGVIGAYPVAPVLNMAPTACCYCGSTNVLFVAGFFGNYHAYDVSIGIPKLIQSGFFPGGGAPSMFAWSDRRSQLVGTDGNNVWTIQIDPTALTKITFTSHGAGLPNTGTTWLSLYDPTTDRYVFTDGNTLYSVFDPTAVPIVPNATLDTVATFGIPLGATPIFFPNQLPQGFIALLTQNQNIELVTSDTLTPFVGVANSGWSIAPAAPGGGFGLVVYNPVGNGFVDYGFNLGLGIYHPVGNPITLASIVEDVCLQCGLSGDQIDVADLENTTVFGYMVGQESSGRAAIEPLQEIFLFDMVESDGQLHGRLRLTQAANVAMTISEDDLGARSSTGTPGENPQPKVVESRKQDVEIPQYVFLRYKTAQGDFYVSNFSFAIATQYAKRARAAVSGLAHLSFNTPIVMDDATAATAVAQILYLQYLNRVSVVFTLPISYIKLVPGDVIFLNWTDQEGKTVSYPIYITQADLGADNTIKVSGVATNSNIFLANVPGQTVQPFLIPMNTGQPTTLQICETPPLRDQDDSPGFYWGACGLEDSSGWGCTLFRSIDEGQSFASLGSDLFPASMGITTNALGAAGNPVSGLWDKQNTVTVRLIGGAPLSSVTPLQVCNLQNHFLIGREMVGASNVVQNADGTYTLSTLLRGVQGTDIFIGSHVPGENATLMVLDGSIHDEDMQVGDIGLDYIYAPVTAGSDFASARLTHYPLLGTRIRPEAVCNVSLQRDASNNAMITFCPRNRIGYQWLDGKEQVTDEPVEAYQVDIFNSAGTTVVRTISDFEIGQGTVGNTPNSDTGIRMFSYPAVNQATDGLVGAGATWNPADNGGLALSNGDLFAINHSGGVAGVRALIGVSAGLYYFEITPNQLANNGTGVGLADASFIINSTGGGIGADSHSIGVNALGALANNQACGIAVNFTTRRLWMRQNQASQWNGSPTADPVAGIGGRDISGMAFPLFPVFQSLSGGGNEQATFNPGNSAFAGIVPAGFSSGWPGPNAPPILATIYEISTRVGRGFPRTIAG